ncbi:signal recognition particle receptor subunit alpha, partial [Ligaoa zhengdingensis]
MGFFQKIKEGLTKTRNSMVKSFEGMLNSFTKIDEELFEELEEILIMSDVGVHTAGKICERLRVRVKETGTTDPSEVKGLLKEIITEMMEGGEELDLSTKPSIILVIGVNGVGKTTTIGKMAAELRRRGKKVLLGAADTFRAAAIDQLGIWAERAGCEMVHHAEGSDPAAVVFDSITAGKARGVD